MQKMEQDSPELLNTVRTTAGPPGSPGKEWGQRRRVTPCLRAWWVLFSSQFSSLSSSLRYYQCSRNSDFVRLDSIKASWVDARNTDNNNSNTPFMIHLICAL